MEENRNAKLATDRGRIAPGQKADLVLWDAQVSSLAGMVPEARMTVGADGGADGDQIANAVIELHGGFSFSALRDEGTPQKDTSD